MRGAALERVLGCWVALAAASAWAPAAASENTASPDRYKLETSGWRRGCPSRAQLLREIVSNLGRDPFSPDAERTVLVSIESEDGGLGGTVELLGPERTLIGKRAIAASHRRCEDLSKALSLVVTLALDERARAQSESPSKRSAEFGVAASTTSAQSELSLSVPRVQSKPLRLRWVIAAGADGSVASGPGPGVGGLLAAEGRGSRWSIGLEGGGDVFLGAPVSGGRVHGSVEAATLTGCWRPMVFGGQFVGACGLATGGLEQAQANSIPNAHAAGGPFVAMGARFLAELPITGELSLILNADPVVPVVRARFTFGNLDLWQAPPISLAGGVRLAYAL